MVYQSNFRLADDEKAKVDRVREGVYVIANAYEGAYDYFRANKLERAAPPSQKPTEKQSDKK